MKIVIFILIFSLCLLFSVSMSFAGQWKYNPFEKKWEWVKEDETLKYNPFEKEWEYVKPDEELKYNPFEKEWQWIEPD